MENHVKISDDAFNHLVSLGIANLKIEVVGGGCSGYSYKLDDVEPTDISEKDIVIELEAFKVIVAEKSAAYLKGLVLGYDGGLNGQGFTFDNPNAKKCCGCGTSFSC